MRYALIFLLFINFILLPQPGNPIDKTTDLLKRNEIHEFAAYFGPETEITINTETKTYSKAEAEKVVTEFFKRNHPQQVNVLHRIESSSNFRFGVYIIRTSNGAYRAAISFKNNGGEFIINELRIESEKTK